MDEQFAKEMVESNDAWRTVVTAAVTAGVSVPAMGGSLAYFDSYVHYIRV